MSVTDRVYMINQWYDRLPQQQAFLLAWYSAWGMLVAALMVTWVLRFPFWLVAGALVIFFMLPRVLFKFDLLDRSRHLPAREEGGPTQIAFAAPEWVREWNARFDEQPDPVRIAWVAAATMAVFFVAIVLHWLIRLPLPLLPMLALLVLGWARVIHSQGWIAPRPGFEAVAPAPTVPVAGPPEAAEAAPPRRTGGSRAKRAQVEGDG